MIFLETIIHQITDTSLDAFRLIEGFDQEVEQDPQTGVDEGIDAMTIAVEITPEITMAAPIVVDREIQLEIGMIAIINIGLDLAKGRIAT